MHHNFSYFTFESFYVRNDLILLYQFYSYASAKEEIEETHAFLVRMDRKGIKWLIFVPDTLFIRGLFSNYRFYPLGSSRSGGLIITNYRAK